MSDHRHGSLPPIDHEIDARSIVRVGAWLAVITVAGFVIGWGFYLFLSSSESKLDALPSPIAGAHARAVPPGPGLQATPELDLASLQRAEQLRLESWQWIDRDAGMARIPVAEAIERVAAQGHLPDFSQPLEILQP